MNVDLRHVANRRQATSKFVQALSRETRSQTRAHCDVLLASFRWRRSAALVEVRQASSRIGLGARDRNAVKPRCAVQDASLLEDVPEGLEVWSYPVWEPTRLLSAVGIGGSSTSRLGADQAKSYSMKNRMLNWVRGNFFVPDARVGWVDPTSRKVLKNFEQILST